MSTPSGGHPDWQTIVQSQTLNLFAALQPTYGTGNTDTPVIPTGNYGSIQCLCQATGAGMQLSVHTYTDAAGVNEFAVDTLLLRQGGVVQPRFPIRGPFIRLRIFNNSGGSAAALTWAQLVSTATPTMTFPITSAIAGENSRNLAASGTLTYALVVMKPGLANFHFKPADATGKLNVSVFTTDEFSNPVLDIATFTGLVAEVNTQLVLPARPVSMQVINTDGAAAHTYSISLICPPSVG